MDETRSLKNINLYSNKEAAMMNVLKCSVIIASFLS